jgi:hypothetical protein
VLAKIEWGKIGELLWVAPVAAIVVALMFSLLVFGGARADDARRDGATGAAALYGVLAAVAGIAFFGAVVFGVSVITTK